MSYGRDIRPLWLPGEREDDDLMVASVLARLAGVVVTVTLGAALLHLIAGVVG